MRYTLKLQSIITAINQSISDFTKVKSYTDYLHHFQLHFIKANELKKRDSAYIVYHQILSPIQLKEIQWHYTINTLLSKVRTHMTQHFWNEDETKIANLGFFIGVDASNLLHDKLEEQVKTQIHIFTKWSKTEIPRFLCAFSSPFYILATNSWTLTKTYNLQVRQKDAADIIELLQCTYSSNPIFMFHKIRHNDPNTYVNAICSQNRFLDDSWVIPILGISKTLKFYLESDIMKTTRSQKWQNTKKNTNATRRWNIISISC